MLRVLLRLLAKSPIDPVEVRYRRYSNRADIPGHPLIAYMDAPLDTVRQILPFLADHNQMTPRIVDRQSALAYNGDLADEMHQFDNVTANGSRLTRLLVREGRVVEVTLKG